MPDDGSEGVERDIIMNAVRGTHGIRNTGDTDMQLLVFEVQTAEQQSE